MPSFNYDLWVRNGEKLKDISYPKKYLTPEKYTADNPLESLVVLPDFDKFFGTKVLNIFIVGVPFGWKKEGGEWSDHWPPEGLDDAKQRHMDTYEKFTSYKTLVYMDYNLVDRVMSESPNSKFREMMDAVKGHMSDLCNELQDFGFEMMDDITSEVGPDHFKAEIDEFYGIEQ